MIQRVLSFFLIITALGLGAAFSAPAANAQGVPFWVRGYPQAGATGCVDYVALWSDGSFSSVPWSCPAGFLPVRDGTSAVAASSFPQQGLTGCIEYVVIWNDGVTTWVPVSCPPGVIYPKPAVAPVAPVAPAPVFPIGPPQPIFPGPGVPGQPPIFPPQNAPGQPPMMDPNVPFHPTSLQFERQCGFTLLKIYVMDAFGNPLNGLQTRVEWDNMVDPPITTNPTGKPGSYEAGWTDASLSGRGMVIGTWRVWVLDANGNRISDIVQFDTNNDCESANAKQIVTVTFQASPGPPALLPM